MEPLCSKYEEMMFNFIDGELTEAQADEFNKHITGCESCRAEFERRKKTVKLIAESAYEPESSLAAAVTGNIAQIKKNRKRFGWGSTIAACAVAVIILSNFFFMDMYRKNINKTDDMALSENSVNQKYKAELNTADGNISDTSQETETASQILGIYGIVPDEADGAGTAADNAKIPSSEMQETTVSEEKLPEAAPPITKGIRNSETADQIDYNTKLYAPDYYGKVSFVIISYEKIQTEAKLIKDADNFTVYIIDYSPETSQLLQQSAEKDGSAFYSAEPSDDTPYILYVYLKKA